MTTKDFTDSLREVAAFYEAHPELPLPDWTSDSMSTFTVWAKDDKLSFMAYAKAFGSFDKRTTSDDFELRKSFGCITIVVAIKRSEVCTRRVVGTKKVIKQVPVQYEHREVEEEIVEWDCPGSLLKPQLEQPRKGITHTEVIEDEIPF
jgi:hypothetical protein